MSDSKPTAEYHTAEDLKALLHEAEQALSHTAGEAGDKIDELRARLRTALRGGKDAFDQVRSEAGQLVRAHPYYAMGIAAGVGTLLGILISRSCNGSR